jgi:hypothetical protein
MRMKDELSSVDIDPYWLADLLGGDVEGLKIYAPGPGHSCVDRSMSITIEPDSEIGYLYHSFSPQTSDLECYLYVESIINQELEKTINEGDCGKLSNERTY